MLNNTENNGIIDVMNRQRRNYINDPQRILDTATPQRGTVTYIGAPSESEQRAIDWIYNNIGGNITVLAENNLDGVANPDLLWNNVLVDMKHTAGTASTLDSHVQKAIRQTNRGGVIVDVTNTKIEDEDTIRTVLKRLQYSRGRFAPVLKGGTLLAYITEE